MLTPSNAFLSLGESLLQRQGLHFLFVYCITHCDVLEIVIKSWQQWTIFSAVRLLRTYNAKHNAKNMRPMQRIL
ncbi:CLUMA_CG007933, isoform A [Clunio marinus]|uniref:CLUMA_CG007933, isoform A n=1 Tax=Clunio marinus TaxID=568069 RepID=A0A1J1I3U1_9DIPT|nr:CLUMA_CG007933, isoform A [Clunio marinus]